MACPPCSRKRYLYAIVQCGEALVLDERQGYDVSLRNIPCQGIGAIAGDLLPGMGTATMDDVLRHERIVEQLMGRFTLLPVRFGTILADDGQVASLLAAHAPAFERNFKRVAHRVELGVKVLWAAHRYERETEDSSEWTARCAREGAAGPGKQYLFKRLQALAVADERRRRAMDLTEAIHRRLLANAAEGACAPSVSLNLVMNAHYLVEKTEIESFRQTVMRLESEQPDLSFLCSGPWPPYNFIDPELGFGKHDR